MLTPQTGCGPGPGFWKVSNIGTSLIHLDALMWSDGISQTPPSQTSGCVCGGRPGFRNILHPKLILSMRNIMIPNVILVAAFGKMFGGN